MSSRVTVKIMPATVYLEKCQGFQRLSFDLWFENGETREFTLRAIELWAYDREGKLFLKRRVDDNGLNPGIETLPERTLSPGASLYLFNPLDTFDRDLELARIRCVIHFRAEREDVAITTEIFPEVYRQKTQLIVPIKGRIFVDDGHDYYSHHRRLALNHPIAQQFGITANSGRYGWDFMLVDEEGNTHRSSNPRNEDYYGFGTPVLAPGDGVVVQARNDVMDNLLGPVEGVGKSRLTFEDFLAEPILMAGNHVVIDHGNGEFSMLGHLQKGSVRVKEGDFVKQGQVIGKLGNSGASGYPHLHYQLMDGPDFRTAEGLPCQFLSYNLILGGRKVTVEGGIPESGEIIIAGGTQV